MLGPAALLVTSVSVLTAATAGALAGVEPFATWYYPLAWYPTLLTAEAVIRLRTGRYRLLGRPVFGLALLLWSVPFWLFFEVVNLRVANWYYVFLPPSPVARWTGIVLSFATVLPAIFLSQALLATGNPAARLQGPPIPVTPRLTWILQGVGVAMTALALAWPGIFFPLVWGAVTFLVDPWVFRRETGSTHGPHSLLRHLRDGRWDVPVRLLLGGLAIGFLWEIYNGAARGRWIYTVPGLEELKLFEMPLPGFLGFPVLALDGYAVWQGLHRSRLAPSWLVREPTDTAGGHEAHRPRGEARGGRGGAGARGLRRRLLVVVPLAVAFSVTALLGMERWTVTSFTPELEEIVEDGAAVLRASRLEVDGVRDLARAHPGEVSEVTGAGIERAREWVAVAELATLRGIGIRNARRLRELGVEGVPGLAEADAGGVADALWPGGMPGGERVWRARVRVWVRAGGKAVESSSAR